MRECMTETMYEKLGISKEVYEFGQTIEAGLKERFSQMDEVAEYNQLKVLHAMQENKVSEGCFNYASGYGYNDMGRDTLEQVYASTFHTEAGIGSSADYLWNARPCPCPLQQTYVRETNCSRRWENHMIRWRK